MKEIEIKKIVKINEKNLNKITEWIYNCWGRDEMHTFEEIKKFVKHSLQETRLPQTYGAFINNEIIGMYQFLYEDLFVRPDIYPWLSNVYVDERYRNNGICRKLMETVKENARNNINFNELYLYTKHVNLYEKFGWKYISDIDTCNEEQRIQRLYKLELAETEFQTNIREEKQM